VGHRDAAAVKIPPALAAKATADVLALLGDPPQRVLEIGFAGIHATPLRLAGFEVEVLDDDPRAVERAGAVVETPTGRYDAVVVTADTELRGVDARMVIRVGRDGLVSRDDATPVD
jgi:hypothetical protein